MAGIARSSDFPSLSAAFDAAAARERLRRHLREGLVAGWTALDRGLGLQRRLRARYLPVDGPARPGATLLLRCVTERPAAGVPTRHPGDPVAADYAARYRGWYPAPVEHVHGVMALEDARLDVILGVHDSAAGIYPGSHCGADVPGNPKYAVRQHLLPLAPAAGRHREGVLLCPAWHHNFYHWMIDILPRLALLEEAGVEAPLVVPAPLRGFQRQTLELLGLGPRLLPLGPGVHRFDRLVLPGNIAPALDFSDRSGRFLRDRLLPPAQAAAPGPRPGRRPRRRLYLSRADAAIRRMANEEELLAGLRRLGFERFVPGEHTVAAQAAAFAEAEFLVGPHGAALAGLAFCVPGTAVVEVFCDGHFSPSYFRIAETLGLVYGFMVGERRGAHLAADPEGLAALVRAMTA